MNDPRSILPYPDSPARDTIIIDRAPTAVRVSIPPTLNWRKLSRGFYIGFVVLGALTLLFSTMAFVNRHERDVGAFYANGGIYGFALLLVIATAHDRIHRRFIFEITGDAFTLKRISFGGGVTTWSWRRSDIGAIHSSDAGTKIAIHVPKRELVQLYISPDRAVVEQAIQAVQEALREVPATDSNAAPGSLPQSDALPHGNLRTAMLCVSGVIIAAAIFVAIKFGPCLAMYVLALAGIPAGIALGSQDKDYYFF